MKRILFPALIAGGSLWLAGCVSDGLSVRENQNDYGLVIDSLCQRTNAVAAPARIRGPIRVAVAQIGETAPAAAFIDNLSGNSTLIAQAIPIPMPGISENQNWRRDKQSPKSSLDEKVAAAQNLARELGADYLLVLGGNIDTRTAHNPLSVLDFTIVGGAIAPGVNVYAEGKASGALVEAATGRVVFLTTAETRDSGLSRSFYSREKCDQLEVKTRDALLKQLARAFLENLRREVSS